MKKYILIIYCACTVFTNTKADQGITSSIHSENVGKIVFTDNLNAITFKKEQPNLFKTSFRASENIYARLYLDKSIANTLHQGEKSYQSILMWDLKIDNKKISHKRSYGMYRHIPKNELTYFTEAIESSDKFSSWTSWRPYLLPDTNDPELQYGNINIAARSFALSLLDLSIGSHDIELSVYSKDMASNNNSQVLAKGSFTLLITKDDKSELIFKYTPPLPKDEWRGADSEKLIEELKLAFSQELNKEPLIVGLYGYDWKEGSYKISGQKYRKLSGWAVFEDTNNDGQVPITTFNWISDYSPGGWTKLRFDSHCNGCPDWDIEVESVISLLKNK